MKKTIRHISNNIISDMIKEWYSIEDIVIHFKNIEPKSKLEKRIIQRGVCVLNWYLMHLEWKINNNKLVDLIKFLS
jgi:hypothetical protein